MIVPWMVNSWLYCSRAEELHARPGQLGPHEQRENPADREEPERGGQVQQPDLLGVSRAQRPGQRRAPYWCRLNRPMSHIGWVDHRCRPARLGITRRSISRPHPHVWASSTHSPVAMGRRPCLFSTRSSVRSGPCNPQRTPLPPAGHAMPGLDTREGENQGARATGTARAAARAARIIATSAVVGRPPRRPRSLSWI